MATVADSQEAQLYWLALHLVPGLGSGRAGRLIRRLGSPQAVFHASATELEECGVRAAVAESIASGVSFEEAAAEAEAVRGAGVEIITWNDPRYPGPLKEIYDPPILLYARGRTELLGSFQIAVVGSRKPSPYGNAVAEKLSGELAAAGLVVTSGLARGIDTAAHRGALKTGGNTIAVLGSGIDVIYPSENRKLAEEIAGKGLLLSEFPLGTASYPQNFPIRNRIISGMGSGVMIVEGAQYSGSLITARLALDQGREVFAVPGNITSKLSWAPNLLIKQGATLVQEWKDIVEALPTPVRRMISEAREGEPQQNTLHYEGVTGGPETSRAAAASVNMASAQATVGLPALQQQLLELLQADASTHIDTLIGKMEQSSPSEVIAALCELELLGLIRQLPGKNFLRVW